MWMGKYLWSSTIQICCRFWLLPHLSFHCLSLDWRTKMDNTLQHFDLIIFILLSCHWQLFWPIFVIFIQVKVVCMSIVDFKTNSIDMFFSSRLKLNMLLSCFRFFSQFVSYYIEMIFLFLVSVMLTTICSSCLLLSFTN